MNSDEMLVHIRAITDSLKSNYLEEITKTQKVLEGFVTKFKAAERLLKSNDNARKVESNTDGLSLSTALDIEISGLLGSETEVLRIKDELVTNSLSFISTLFKQEFPIKFDKTNKAYYVQTPTGIVRKLSEITKINKVTGGVNQIASLQDFYLFQLISLDGFYKHCISKKLQAENDLQEQRRKEGNGYGNGSGNGQTEDTNQLQMFQNELQNMKETFKKKTMEFTEMEFKKNKAASSKLVQDNKKLIQDFNRLKKTTYNLLNSYRNKEGGSSLEKGFNDLEDILSNSTDTQKYDPFISLEREIGTGQSPIRSRDFYLDTDNSDTSIDPGKKSAGFVDKVVNEFDKILNEETKRIENYFNDRKSAAKEEYKRQRNTQILNFKKDKGEKNYVEWKPDNENWKNALRVKSATPEKKTSENKDIRSLASETKDKIKNSIAISPNQALKKINLNKSMTNEDFTYAAIQTVTSNFYDDASLKRKDDNQNSRVLTGSAAVAQVYQQKANKEKKRENFENDMRAQLFGFKKKK